VPDWATILAAIADAEGGDRATGREALLTCWALTSPQDHAHRCVLAHYLADLQDLLDDEVAWDRVALEEHRHLPEDALVAVGIPDVTGLAPSLHLNLGDGYLREGRMADASDQLRQGLESVDALADDGYGRMVRDGLARLASRIEESSAGR
jgi:hypothetical protein